MAPEYFPLRWESTGDQWWFASPIDWAAANGLYNIVRELLRLDSNLLIKLTSLRRIRRLETVWDDEAQFDDVARCRAHVARQLFHESETKRRSGKPYNSLIRGGYGGWLMYTAASAGDVGFVRGLLGRDPFMVFGEGEYGVTDILYAASRSKNSEVFRVVLDIAMSPRSCLSGVGEVVSEGGLSNDVDLTFKSEMMNRAVHAAARGGNMEVLKDLLEGCSDVLMYRDAQGSTLLHTASGRGQVEVVKYLIESYDKMVCARDNEGNTALHVAAYRGFLTAVEILIKSCHSLAFAVNNHGDTFLHFAVAGFRTLGFRRIDQQIDLMKKLVGSTIIDIGEEDIINMKNKDGRTALHVAVSENIQTNLVELLMSVPFINLNIRDLGGMTPLDLLKRRPKSASSEILIKRLISAGGISNALDVKARSALASHLREGLSLSASPGTSFKIPDAEIFLYTGIEHSRSSRRHDYSSSMDYSQCLSENDAKVSTSSPSPLRRLRFLFRRKSRKSARSEFRDEDSLDSMYIGRSFGDNPISLRQQYCSNSKGSTPSPDSITEHKRSFSDTNRSSFPSPSSRKKFTASLTQGVIQPKTRFSYLDSSCPSSGGSSVSSPVMSNMQFSGPLQPSKNRAKVVKRLSFNKKLMNQYLCFGAQNLGTEENRVVMV